MPVVVNLKHIFDFFWLYNTCFIWWLVLCPTLCPQINSINRGMPVLRIHSWLQAYMKIYVGFYKTFKSSQFSSCSASIDCALLCSKSVVMLNRAIWVMTHEWISLKLIFSVSALCRYVKYMLNTTNVWGILNMYANSYLPLSSVVKYLCSFGQNLLENWDG